MSTISSRSQDLSARPSLEQQRKRARELLRAARVGDPTALDRFRRHHPRFAAGSSLRLADAQLVIAREAGLPSWPRLVAQLRGDNRRTRLFVTQRSYYEDRAQGLLSTQQQGLPASLAQIRAWHPRFARASDDEVAAGPFTIEDARLVYARQHGFKLWDDRHRATAGAAGSHPRSA
jgi:hypothetical protein